MGGESGSGVKNPCLINQREELFKTGRVSSKNSLDGTLHPLIHSQQSEVLACQDGGEMFKTLSSYNRTRVVEVGILTRNPPVDT